MLSAETFDADQALTAGLVSEVVPAGQQFARANEVAQMIAVNAPLAVQLALAGQRAAERPARDAAWKVVLDNRQLLQSKDAAEGMKSMMERRDPIYIGE